MATKKMSKEEAAVRKAFADVLADTGLQQTQQILQGAGVTPQKPIATGKISDIDTSTPLGATAFKTLTAAQSSLDKALDKITKDYDALGYDYDPITNKATKREAVVKQPIIPPMQQGLQADQVQKMISDALAAQQAKFDAATKQAAADKAAEAKAAKVASQIKAKDKLTAMLAPYKLEGLASYIDAEILKDTSEEMILLGMYDQPSYKTRFPGMEGLRKVGRTISEDEYTRIENAMIQTARFFDLPKGFYDNPEDFGNLIAKQVSAKEYQDRLQVGQDLARTLNSSIKQQLVDLYAIGEGDLTAYVLDPEKALSLIQKQAKAATFVGLSRAAGFRMPDITAATAENIVGTEPYAKLTEAQMQAKIGQAGELRKEQQRLSQIEGTTYNEQEALSAVIEGSPEAILASQQRAQREVSRFRARSGVTATSLGTGVNV
jgi:hypothetical protein